MVKLTVENLPSKLGRIIDLKTLKEIQLKKKQIDEIGSFSGLPNLEKVDLSDNVIRFQRQIEKLLEAPNLKELNLTGNPVCKTKNYRAFVIALSPKLKILDNQEISAQEREESTKISDSQVSHPLSVEADQKKKEEEERKRQLEQEKEERKKEKEKLMKEEEARREKEKQKQDDLDNIREQERKQKAVQAPAPVKASPPPTASSKPLSQPPPSLPKTSDSKPGQKEDVQVFRDARSKMVITDRLTSGEDLSVKEEKKIVQAPKRNIFEEDSLFETNKENTSLFSKDEDQVNFSFEDDTLEKLEKKKRELEEKKKGASFSSLTFSEDISVVSTNTTSQIDDDLFSLVDNKTKGETNTDPLLNLDDYLAQNQTSSGGLFDQMIRMDQTCEN